MRQTVALRDWQDAQGRQREDRAKILQAREEIVSALKSVKRGRNVGEENLERIFSGIIKAAEILGSDLIPREVFDDLQQGNAMRYLKELSTRGCFGEKTSYAEGRGCKFSKLHLVVERLPKAGGSNHTKQKPVQVEPPAQLLTEKPAEVAEIPSIPQIAYLSGLADEIAGLVVEKLNGTVAKLTATAPSVHVGQEGDPIPVFAFVDWPNHERWRRPETEGGMPVFQTELNPLALRGLLVPPGHYLQEARLYVKPPPRYNKFTVGSWKFDADVRILGFQPFYEYNGRDIDPLMREDIGKSTFLSGMQPGSRCSVVIGSGDGGYVPYIKRLKAMALNQGVKCRIRLLTKRGSANGLFAALVDEIVVVTNLAIYL